MIRTFSILGAVMLCGFVASGAYAQASCYTCAIPPGGGFTCENTYYNAGTGCVWTSYACQIVGSCQGALGPCRGNQCIPEYACGAPLGKEWRLERVEIKTAADVSRSAARNS